MTDPRVDNLARILVRYCLGVKKEQTVGIEATAAGMPLVSAMHEALLPLPVRAAVISS